MADTALPPGDEDAWLYESKEANGSDAPPDIVDPAVNAEESQEDQQVTVIEESQGEEKAPKEKTDAEEGDEEEEEEDDEDDVDITIGDPKAAPPPATGLQSTTFTATPVNLNIKKTTTTAVTSAPGGQLIKVPQKGVDVDAVANINGTSIYEFNIDSLEEKPWRKPGADITDYFNYGFTEDSWKAYCDRQRRTRADNNAQNMKHSFQNPMGQMQNNIQVPGGNFDKPYRPSYPQREFKEYRKSAGTIDVIGGQNSRRPANDEHLPPVNMMPPPMTDLPYPPGMPPPNFDPHIPPPHQVQPPPHGMPMHLPPFDPRFPPPSLEMVGPPPFQQGPHDPYGSGPPQQPPPMMDSYHRQDERPIEDADYDRRRHRYDDMSRSRDDREDRDGRRYRDRMDDRRDRERDDRDRRDRDRGDRKDKDRERDRDRDSDRNRSSRKTRRHDDDDDDRRSSSKHKRSKRDDE